MVDLAHQLGADRVKAYHMFSFSEEMNEESLMPILEEYTPILMDCLLYTSPSPRDAHESRMPSSA